jgi:hypothetical protein
MRTALCTFAMLASAATTHAGVPQGPDAIHGAFARMLDHESAALSTAAANPDAAFVEHWVNSASRRDMGSLEAGFVHMLERTRDVPQPLVARGEPDPLASLVAAALHVQQAECQRFAGGPLQ